jgi:metal-sulfur cluster biosynthetic enzyme
MGEFLAEDVRNKILSVPNVTQVNVDLTFDPPWNQTMMSEAARLQTGLY